MKMIYNCVNHFFDSSGKLFCHCSPENNYGKPVNALSLFIKFCDVTVKIALTCTVNSFAKLYQISAFRKIANSLPAVVICRYESLHCDDRFVMKQNHNHESDQINCFCCRLFYQHNNKCSKRRSFFRFRT